MNFDFGNMYFSSRSEGGQHPPRYFSQHPKNYNGKHYPFSVQGGGGSNSFSSYNASLNRGPPTTTSTNYDNPNYMPLSTPRRNLGWKCNPDSIPQSSPNPQPTTGHYCHLSYYGEEVDKEYLPSHHLHHIISSNESATQFDPLNESSNLMTSLRKSTNNGNTSTFKRTIGQRFNDGGDKCTYNQQQETERFRNSDKRWGRHVKNEGYQPEETLDDDDSVLVRNFQTAASCFQRQASQNEDFTLASPESSKLQDGWSGVTTLRTQRKVVIKDDGKHATKFPKMQKSFHTHFDLKSRRNSANMSLDEIIKTSHGIKRRLSYADQVTEGRHESFNPNKSTWLSGEGKSFRIRRATSQMHAQRKRHRYSSAEAYQNLDGKFTGKNEGSQYFSPSMQSRYHKRQNSEWAGSWRNFNRDDVVKTEKRPVVIDGSNVAFAYGEDLHFECKGIDECVAHFMEKGCDDISVIVPKDRLKPGASKDVEILQELKQKGMIIVNWNGQFASGSDDRYFILDVALDKGAIIVSNLNFTDVARAYPKMRHNIWNRVINFEFTSDSPKEILFPNIDPTGMCGPTWNDVLHN